jgi:hypothetical protein
VHQRAGAHDTPDADAALWHDGCTDANKSALADSDITAEVGARGNVGMIGDNVVMIHRTPGVENDVLTDGGSGVHHHTGKDDGAGANCHIRRNHGARMYDGDDLFA